MFFFHIEIQTMVVQITPISPTEIFVQTENYEWKVFTKSFDNAVLAWIGTNTSQSLELYIPLNEGKETDMAILNHTASLVDLSLKHIENDYQESSSIAKEIFDFVRAFLKQMFPGVKYLQVQDESQKPCNREKDQVLDLLVYSVALLEKTWYEMKLPNMYCMPKETQEEYRKQIEIYAGEENKKSYPFEQFLQLVQSSENTFAKEIFASHATQIEDVYSKSPTFPGFFKLLSTIVPKKEKSRLFFQWLERFLEPQITIPRHWQCDL